MRTSTKDRSQNVLAFIQSKGWEHKEDENNYLVKVCPFCEKANYKFALRKTDGYYWCWTCPGGRDGPFRELLSELGEDDQPSPKRSGRVIDLDAEIAAARGGSSPSVDNSTSDPAELGARASAYHHELWCRPGCLEYVRGRGFTDRAIKHFRLGAQKRNDQFWLTIPHIAAGEVVNIKYRLLPPGKKAWRQESNAKKIIFNQDVLPNCDEVILTEGELKTAALWQTGFENCVGLTGGVNAWNPEWKSLFGAATKIFLCLDSDQPGQSAAAAIAARLGYSRCYNIVLPDAKDADEYFFEKGHSADDFRKLMAEAKRIPKAAGLSFMTVSELLAEPDEEVNYVVDGLLIAGGISVLTAKPKVGKSTLAQQLAACVASGTPFLNRPTTPGPVLYVGLEDIKDQIKKRLRTMGIGLDSPNFLLHIGNKIGDQPFDELEDAVRELKPTLVIIDTMARFMRTSDVNDYARVSSDFDPFITLARDSKAHVVFVHHNRKGGDGSSSDDMLGSTAIFGSVDTAIRYRATDERRRLISTEQRYGEPLEWTEVLFDEDTQLLTLGSSKEASDEEAIAERIYDYLLGCDEPQTCADVVREVKGDTNVVKKILKSLVDEGRVIKSGKGVKNDPFLYSADETSEDFSFKGDPKDEPRPTSSTDPEFWSSPIEESPESKIDGQESKARTQPETARKKPKRNRKPIDKAAPLSDDITVDEFQAQLDTDNADPSELLN